MSVDPVSLAITAALTAANMALTMSRKIEGPRLDSLDVTTASYGAALNYFYGTRRFDGCSVIWAEPIREEQSRNKTKGGKYNDYKYYGTWAVAVADQEIDAVTRIWFDRHLVYDATGTGPISPIQVSDGSIVDFIRIYLGTDTQEPDPRIQATIDALHGAGSTPAYRGVAYIVFEELPLEKLGNRLPQVSVEAVANATPTYPVESVETTYGAPSTFAGFMWAPNHERFIYQSALDRQYEIWDTASRASMITGALQAFTVGTPPNEVTYTPRESVDYLGLSSTGAIYTIAAYAAPDPGESNPLGGAIVVYNPDGIGAGALVTRLQGYSKSAHVVRTSDGREFVGVQPLAGPNLYATLYALDGIGGLVQEAVDYSVEHYFADLDDNVWAVGRDGSDLVLHCLVGDRAGQQQSVAMGSSGSRAGGYHYRNDTVDHFVVFWDDAMHTIDATSFAVTNSLSIPVGEAALVGFMSQPVGRAAIFVDSGTGTAREVSSVDLAVIRTLTLGSIATWNTAVDGFIYDPINHALLAGGGGTPGDPWNWLYLDRVGGNGVTLASIFDDITARVGLTPGTDTDSTALTQEIAGYSWTQGSGKAVLEPLFEFYDADLRPHDFELQGVNRSGVSGGTITTPYMGASSGDKGVRYSLTRTLDTDLPAVLNISFADPAIDQQSNSVPVVRANVSTDAKREVSVDLTTLVLSVDEARQGAERIMRRRWFGRDGIETTLGRRHIGLEPADVRTLDLDGISRSARLLRLEIGANGVLSTTWERDGVSIAVLPGSSGAPADGHTPPVVTMPGITRGFVLDIPLITDAHDATTPTMYFAASSYSPDVFWPGATIYVDETAWSDIPATSRATWGITTDALGDGDPLVWDRGSEVTVEIKNGTLTSATEAQLLASPTLNLALIGDELVQFATATLNVDGTYTLTKFLRGRRGTEWATGDHTAGDTFLLLTTVDRQSMGASDVGQTETYTPATIGRSLTSSFPVTVAFTGASLKPYAPAHVEGVRDGSDNLTISWIRRTRIGGAWRDGSDASLGETSEAYEVDIMDGDDVVRTLSGLTSPEAEYSAADQTTDFGSPQSSVAVRVYQLSSVVGRGFAAEATV